MKDQNQTRNVTSSACIDQEAAIYSGNDEPIVTHYGKGLISGPACDGDVFSQSEPAVSAGAPSKPHEKHKSGKPESDASKSK